MANRYLSSAQRNRAKGLLDMMYSPEDLQWELGIDEKRLKLLIGLGLHHLIDSNGHIWVRGIDFTAWSATFDKQNKIRLLPGQAYCVKCKKAVFMLHPERKQGYVTVMLVDKCPECGAKVSRTIRHKSPQ